MLTGESVSVLKGEGDKVYGGTINASGVLRYRAEYTGKDTVLAKIIEIVEQAQAETAPISKTVDKVSAVFVPVVCGIALLSFIVWLIFSDLVFALTVMTSVFVIACPCALGLATPAAIVTGTGKGAQMGILFKSAEALQKLSEVKAFVFDKTGTLTQGKPYVTDIFAAEGFTKLQVLTACALAEKGSNHPIAGAVLAEAQNREIDLEEIDLKDFKTYQGLGVEVNAGGKIIKAGSKKLFDETANAEALKMYDKFSSEGKTAVLVGIGGAVAGAIAAADTPKSDAIKCVSVLKHLGVKTYMLTGDNAKTAEKIAAAVGIEEYFAEVMPAEKADKIKSLKESVKTAMVGDGINDAPALAVADVGIAVGGGTDIAIESADVVLTGKSLRGVADAYSLSKKTMRNVKQNLFWAFIYNLLALPVAAGVLFPLFGILLSPMIAAAAMSFSSVCVVLNALRLNLFKSSFDR
jgi:Cu+-exporting ATPase